ncbi:MAG: hypothetical protein CBB97_05640, partial [Candidatus Endolissoclinum sp. TMED37]
MHQKIKLKKKMKLKKISLKQFNLFKKNVHNIISKIKDFVEKNQPVVGIGAATKGNTLLNCCELTDKHIRFIYDRSIHKINKFTPGSGIKIVKEKNIPN